MTPVVLDTNTVISAVFWPESTARRCLAGLARRWYTVALSAEVFAEYEAIAAEFQPRFPTCNRAGALAWLRSKVKWVEPAPLGKQRRCGGWTAEGGWRCRPDCVKPAQEKHHNPVSCRRPGPCGARRLGSFPVGLHLGRPDRLASP
jgi:hypothetical protein